MTAPRPRWLVPGVVVAIIAAALVVLGVLPFSTVLYAGQFGGMLLMHAGGHGGHGGHAGHGGGHDAHAPTDRSGSETHDHDQQGSHGCH